MRKIDQLLTEYGINFQNSVSRLINFFGVAVIFFSVIGLFWFILLWPLNEAIEILSFLKDLQLLLIGVLWLMYFF